MLKKKTLDNTEMPLNIEDHNCIDVISKCGVDTVCGSC
jgi:hypothetical protein